MKINKDKYLIKDYILNSFFSFCFACEICLIFILTVHISDIKKEILFCACIFLALFIVSNFLCFCIFNFTIKKKIAFLLIIPLLFTAIQFSVFAVYRITYPSNLDDGKSEFYADDNVMIIVPHQDDEVLLAGGIIENYVNYGSNIKVVFTTTGDYAGIGQWRMEETLGVMKYYGIDESDVIFLGYGNEWQGENHIYNAEENEEIVSFDGKAATYALSYHPAYNNGNSYTRNNFKNDLKSVIKEFKPDTVYCIDFDAHADHRASSLLFEEALGEVLHEIPEYNPTVFKGFAYSCALYAVDDYSETNLRSTQNPYDTSYMQENTVFEWDSRIRVPVSAYCVSEKLTDSGVFRALQLYSSQTVVNKSASAVNSDKIFWLRRTDSLLYSSDITASSGNAMVLNDFKLYDTSNVRDIDKIPDDGCGIWYPKKEDKEKTVTVNFSEPHDISSIVLYDNPSLSDNVTAAELVFDNGQTIKVENLNNNGSETKIDVNQKQVQSFNVRILDSSGEYAGLSEIEAYESDAPANKKAFIKLMNSENDFAYVYRMSESLEENFGLYSYYCPELSDENYSVTVSNPKCSAIIKDYSIEVSCPDNCTTYLTVSADDGSLSDTVFICGCKANLRMSIYYRIERWYYNIFNFEAEKKYIKDIIR